MIFILATITISVFIVRLVIVVVFVGIFYDAPKVPSSSRGTARMVASFIVEGQTTAGAIDSVAVCKKNKCNLHNFLFASLENIRPVMFVAFRGETVTVGTVGVDSARDQAIIFTQWPI